MRWPEFPPNTKLLPPMSRAEDPFPDDIAEYPDAPAWDRTRALESLRALDLRMAEEFSDAVNRLHEEAADDGEVRVEDSDEAVRFLEGTEKLHDVVEMADELLGDRPPKRPPFAVIDSALREAIWGSVEYDPRDPRSKPPRWALKVVYWVMEVWEDLPGKTQNALGQTLVRASELNPSFPSEIGDEPEGLRSAWDELISTADVENRVQDYG